MNARAQGFVAGMVVGAVLAGAAAVVWVRSPTVAAQAGVKYTSKVVLENERVRVKDVTFPPGVLDTGMHTHDLAHVGVILTKGSLVFTDPDGTTETVAMDAGSVGFRPANARHQVANPGPGPMRVIEVELK
jgi:quercetin dioxygenase-like cupin family protein